MSDDRPNWLLRNVNVAGHDHATALLVRDGRIAAVGDAEVLAETAPDVAVIDGQGGFVTPGFTDSHCHLVLLAKALAEPDVGAASDERAAAALVANVARDAEPQSAPRWLLARGFDQTRWPGQMLPTRRSLDAAAPGVPIIVKRRDEHCAWLSTAACERLQVATWTDLPNAHIVREPDGAPSGVLYERAMDRAVDLALRELPPVSDEALRHAEQTLRRYGITCAHDLSTRMHELPLLAKLSRLRVRAYLYADDVKDYEQLIAGWAELSAGRHRVVGLKLFLDGALGSRGARLLAPYSDAPSLHGIDYMEPAAVAHVAALAASAGIPLAVHAIGDAAVRFALALPSAGRLRVEHAQVVAAADVARFVERGAVASVQYVHHHDDAAWMPERLGPERLDDESPWRRLRAAGVTLLGGSDAPIASADPLLGVAVCERAPGRGLSRAEAIATYTQAPWQVLGEQDRCGQLRPGYEADVTLWSADLTAASELSSVSALGSAVRGVW